MTEAVAVTLLALTHDGPRGASFPMIMVQAASFDVLRLTVTERTLIRWGCNKHKTNNSLIFPDQMAVRYSASLTDKDMPASKLFTKQLPQIPNIECCLYSSLMWVCAAYRMRSFCSKRVIYFV
jgi:hypothetical protein